MENPRQKYVKSLEIAVDLLDRADGTSLYNITKKISGWTNKDYSQMLEHLALLLIQFKYLEEDEEE
tara:strand:+ start:653 stop:850 length:198 start_codon:yes stop_codon:yes gene_type:complete